MVTRSKSASVDRVGNICLATCHQRPTIMLHHRSVVLRGRNLTFSVHEAHIYFLSYGGIADLIRSAQLAGALFGGVVPNKEISCIETINSIGL